MTLKKHFIMRISAKSGTLLLIAALNSSGVPGAGHPQRKLTHTAYLLASRLEKLSGYRHTCQPRYTRLISDYLSTQVSAHPPTEPPPLGLIYRFLKPDELYKTNRFRESYIDFCAVLRWKLCPKAQPDLRSQIAR